MKNRYVTVDTSEDERIKVLDSRGEYIDYVYVEYASLLELLDSESMTDAETADALVKIFPEFHRTDMNEEEAVATYGEDYVNHIGSVLLIAPEY